MNEVRRKFLYWFLASENLIKKICDRDAWVFAIGWITFPFFVAMLYLDMFLTLKLHVKVPEGWIATLSIVIAVLAATTIFRGGDYERIEEDFRKLTDRSRRRWLVISGAVFGGAFFMMLALVLLTDMQQH